MKKQVTGATELWCFINHAGKQQMKPRENHMMQNLTTTTV